MNLARVFINEGSFGIFDAGEVPIETADWSNDLVAPLTQGAVVLTGINTGNVTVEAMALGAPADDLDAGTWEEHARVRLWSPEGRLRIESLVHGPHPDLPLLSIVGPGWYEAEIRARGRELERDGSNLASAEQYLIVVWPVRDSLPLPSRSNEGEEEPQLLRNRLLRGQAGS